LEELYKAIGGLPGAVSLIAVAAAMFWKFKMPQIGIDLLQRELEVHRDELTEADKDRQELRTEIKIEKSKLQRLEKEFMECLVEKERLQRVCRRQDRRLMELGDGPLPRDEDRSALGSSDD
jgi:septal ring factor EnvC (AmiA/AmiB activator)